MSRKVHLPSRLLPSGEGISIDFTFPSGKIFPVRCITVREGSNFRCRLSTIREGSNFPCRLQYCQGRSNLSLSVNNRQQNFVLIWIKPVLMEFSWQQIKSCLMFRFHADSLRLPGFSISCSSGALTSSFVSALALALLVHKQVVLPVGKPLQSQFPNREHESGTKGESLL